MRRVSESGAKSDRLPPAVSSVPRRQGMGRSRTRPLGAKIRCSIPDAATPACRGDGITSLHWTAADQQHITTAPTRIDARCEMRYGDLERTCAWQHGAYRHDIVVVHTCTALYSMSTMRIHLCLYLHVGVRPPCGIAAVESAGPARSRGLMTQQQRAAGTEVWLWLGRGGRTGRGLPRASQSVRALPPSSRGGPDAEARRRCFTTLAISTEGANGRHVDDDDDDDDVAPAAAPGRSSR